LGREVQVGERRGAHNNFGGEREKVSEQGIDTKIILKCVLTNYYGWVWNGIIWLGIGTTGGLL
jgi:hypothetical protein